MARTDRIGRAGEHLVAGELNRRGAYASPFSGNVPGIDIVATDETQQHMAYIQVKTKTGSNRWPISQRAGWHFPKGLPCIRTQHCAEHPTAQRLWDIPIVEAKDGHFWVFVDLDRNSYAIVPDSVVREHLIRQPFIEYLEKNGGTRPGANHGSQYGLIFENQVADWVGNWSVLPMRLDDDRV